MFMTLKCSGKEAANEMQHLYSTNRLGHPDNMSLVACNSCRKKKLRCSREKAECRRCQLRGIRCVYDSQRIRGSNKSNEGAPFKSNRPEKSCGSSSHAGGQQGNTGSVRGNEGPPGDADASTSSSTIQVALPDTALVPPSGSENGPPRGSSGGSSSGTGSSSAHANKEPTATDQHRPRDQQDEAHEHVLQENATGTSGQLAALDENVDPSLFFDFNEGYLNSPPEMLAKFLDPFGTRGGILSHNHALPTTTQMSDFSGQETNPDGANRQQSMTPHHQQPTRSSPSDGLHLSLDSLGTACASSSASSHNGMHVDTDSCEASNNSYDDGDCECTEMALRILEEVVTPPAGAGCPWAMVENKIILLKMNISRCLVLSRCRGCRQESGICMLTLVIYEKLTSAFEEIAQWWNREEGQSQARVDGHNRREKYQQQQQTRSAMGRYQIDSAEEHRAVFTTIVTWQLQRLSGLSILMTEHSKRAKWPAHVKSGEAVVRRIEKLGEKWS